MCAPSSMAPYPRLATCATKSSLNSSLCLRLRRRGFSITMVTPRHLRRSTILGPDMPHRCRYGAWGRGAPRQASLYLALSPRVIASSRLTMGLCETPTRRLLPGIRGGNNSMLAFPWKLANCDKKRTAQGSPYRPNSPSGEWLWPALAGDNPKSLGGALGPAAGRGRASKSGVVGVDQTDDQKDSHDVGMVVAHGRTELNWSNDPLDSRKLRINSVR